MESQSYIVLRKALDVFIITEQWRRAADTYKKIYQLPIGQVDDRERFFHFNGYENVLIDYVKAQENDFAFLLSVAKKGTSAEYRADAGLTLGLLYFKLFKEEDSIKAYRRVLELTMTDADRASCYFQ